MELLVDGKLEKIVGFKTKWLHPFKGLFDDVSEAIKAAIEDDLEPNQVLRPVTVACGETVSETLLL